MDISLARDYKSPSQVAKILTENWIAQESYCPSCLNTLTQAKANSRVLDFICKSCEFDFELKSKKGIFSKKITDGAYGAMIERLAKPNSPHFFFMNYSPDFKVQNLIAVPAYFIQPSFIERRKPLSENAKRAGWVGCNILSEKIPNAGKVVLIENSIILDREKVKLKWSQTNFLQTILSINSRSWTIDVLSCIEKLDSVNFSLKQLYFFESELAQKHPKNKHIKDKIRQQLQILRDKGLVEFVSPGFYKLRIISSV
ncbi:MAG: DpnI domain-containing protein [Methylotenera sp.]|nr:DpnI domain-containing protein [Methylotenera sp.]